MALAFFLNSDAKNCFFFVEKKSFILLPKARKVVLRSYLGRTFKIARFVRSSKKSKNLIQKKILVLAFGTFTAVNYNTCK